MKGCVEIMSMLNYYLMLEREKTKRGFSGVLTSYVFCSQDVVKNKYMVVNGRLEMNFYSIVLDEVINRLKRCFHLIFIGRDSAELSAIVKTEAVVSRAWERPVELRIKPDYELRSIQDIANYLLSGVFLKGCLLGVMITPETVDIIRKDINNRMLTSFPYWTEVAKWSRKQYMPVKESA